MTYELIGDEILKYKDDIIRHTCELVKIKSVQDAPQAGKPFGSGVDNALNYVLALAEQLGFKTKNVDGYAGHVEFGEGETLVGVLVHLDVVPEGEGWTTPPYSADIRDGKIYGRGSCDNKGPAIVALYSLKALKDAGVVPDKTVRLIFGTNEESGMKDMDYYFSKEPVPDMGFSPDAGYPIYNREKGIMRIQVSNREREADNPASSAMKIKGGLAANSVPDECLATVPNGGLGEDRIQQIRQLAGEYDGCRIEVGGEEDGIVLKAYGKPAHGASPQAGINAVSHLIRFMHEAGLHSPSDDFFAFIRERIGLETNGASLGIACRDEQSGDLTLNLGILEQDAGRSEAVLDIRYPVTYSGDWIASELKKVENEYRVSLSIANHQPPLYVREDHPLLERLSRAYEKMTGRHAELLSMGGGTYARTLRNNGVAFGGAEGGNGHQADEYVVIEGLMYHGRICTQAVYELAVN